MFVGSFKTVEELERKLEANMRLLKGPSAEAKYRTLVEESRKSKNPYEPFRQYVDSFSQRDFKRFLKEQYPKCTDTLDLRHKKFPFTWDLERLAKVVVFGAAEDNFAKFEYYLCQMRPGPRPKEVIKLERFKKAIEAPVRLLERMEYMAGEKSLHKLFGKKGVYFR